MATRTRASQEVIARPSFSGSLQYGETACSARSRRSAILHRCAGEFHSRVTPALAAAPPNAYDRAVNALDASAAVQRLLLPVTPPGTLPVLAAGAAASVTLASRGACGHRP
jgi:hypothetical protein